MGVKVVTWLLALALTASNTVGAAEWQRARSTTFTGLYENKVYWFMSTVPAGFVGERPRAPAPQHGFVVSIGEDSIDSVVVDASWNGQLLESLKQIAEAQVRASAITYGVRLATQRVGALGGLDALELTFTDPTGVAKFKYVRTLVAFRPVPDGVGIIYTVDLRQRARTERGDSLFEAITKSFKLAEIPKIPSHAPQLANGANKIAIDDQ